MLGGCSAFRRTTWGRRNPTWPAGENETVAAVAPFHLHAPARLAGDQVHLDDRVAEVANAGQRIGLLGGGKGQRLVKPAHLVFRVFDADAALTSLAGQLVQNGGGGIALRLGVA